MEIEVVCQEGMHLCVYFACFKITGQLFSFSSSFFLFVSSDLCTRYFFLCQLLFFFFVCVERRGCPVSCMWSTALESKSEKRNMQANQWGELFLGLFANHENKEKRTVFSFFFFFFCELMGLVAVFLKAMVDSSSPFFFFLSLGLRAIRNKPAMRVELLAQVELLELLELSPLYD